MGIRDSPAQTEAQALLEECRNTMELVRATYLRVLGMQNEAIRERVLSSLIRRPLLTTK
jgi:hypothetical protein